MTASQFKSEIVNDLRYQLLRKPAHRNWTAEHWYLHNKFYNCPLSKRLSVIEELIQEGKIRKALRQNEPGHPFVVLELLPID